MEFLRTHFFWIDLVIGFSFPAFFYFLYKTGNIERWVWTFFWVGVGFGLLWEIPIFLLSTENATYPIIRYLQPLPVHYLIVMVCHALWDGGLFLMGIGLVFVFVFSPSALRRFSWKELAIFVVWGQLSALSVELLGIFNDGWAYIPGYWWNPTLFQVKQQSLTLFILFVWFAASILYYLILLRFHQKKRM